MACYFLDSSAVAKLYHTELGSAAVEQMVRRADTTILVSRLAVVEVQSAFAGKVRSGVISAGDAAGLRRRFLEDIANGVFAVVAVTSDHYDQAGELIERHGARRGLRALDALQLAVQSTHAQPESAHFNPLPASH
jgi:predicted nucleic acid-binding protein